MDFSSLDSGKKIVPHTPLLSNTRVHAYAALAAAQALQLWGYEPGPLGSNEVELAPILFT